MSELTEMIKECDMLIEEMDWLEDITKEWHKFFENSVEWGDFYGNAVE